ncbi:response regulator transcription factor [Nocardioides marmoribigeumensis]|uniref:DNA-binding NarL/FixJ family response regulator n=1 Tax=Nocardioides marmoribigeumensis TaxID=433649 RepID=A0ABU2BSD7_9ACTN|nr:response regulator transcription factor [Nocardioides marmoribigeumensis]MDR7361562.1 DNA-binding NarL/FixJ family response regulator [Nocardioides marmoribigeumensis]
MADVEELPATVRVALVDDHRLVRVGLRSLLESTTGFVVVGEAGDGREAVDLVASVAPDVVLMDLSMPDVDGIAATRAIAAAHPEVRVLVLTSFTDRARVQEVLAAGATGYVLKDCEPEELLAAIRAAARGHVPLDPRVAGALLPTPGGGPALSPREEEVLRLVAQGLANKQVARALGITERTVKAHLGRVFREIGVLDRTSAALWAREHLS